MSIDITQILQTQGPEHKRYRADRLRESLFLLLEGRFPTERTREARECLENANNPFLLEHWFLAALKIATFEDFCELLKEGEGLALHSAAELSAIDSR